MNDVNLTGGGSYAYKCKRIVQLLFSPLLLPNERERESSRMRSGLSGGPAITGNSCEVSPCVWWSSITFTADHRGFLTFPDSANFATLTLFHYTILHIPLLSCCVFLSFQVCVCVLSVTFHFLYTKITLQYCHWRFVCIKLCRTVEFIQRMHASAHKRSVQGKYYG